jgi:hypothetical protein
VIGRRTGDIFTDFYISNYLRIVDCINKDESNYQIWTKENLLFWEKRPHKLGTFRDITKAVLEQKKIEEMPVFRVKGWEVMVVIRGDVKQAIEAEGITGCLFTEVEVSP